LLLQYKTVDRVLAERPTVVMMAHINPLKDIVTAIRAAKLIVEEYKVTGMPHNTALFFWFDPDRPMYKAYPNGCQHRLQVLLRLRPYPSRGHRLL